MKTPATREEYEINKRHFYDYTLEKKKFSIAREIIMVLRPVKNWYEGINIEMLREKILENFRVKGYKRRKLVSKPSIYNAIKDINLYCDYCYIVSSWGFDSENQAKEFRYFCPYEAHDLSRTKDMLMKNVFRNQLKSEKLDIFKEELKNEAEILTNKNWQESRN